MKGRMNTNMGKIVVDTEVIAKSAGSNLQWNVLELSEWRQ